MPNRLINESCRASETLAQVSDFAERLFWRLLTLADDHGRFRAEPRFIRAVCFSVMQDRVTDQKIDSGLQELVAVESIQLYQAEGRGYGVFLSWTTYQRCRAKSKLPEPPPQQSRNTRGHMPQYAASVCVYKNPSDLVLSPDPDPDPDPPVVVTPTSTTPKKRATDFSGFAEFWQRYPRKDGKQVAAASWAKLTPEERRLAAEDVPKRMAANWAGRDTDKLPHASTYLNQRRWLDGITPVARLPDARPRLSPGMERLGQRYLEALERERNGSNQAADADQSRVVQTTGRSVRSG